MESIRKKVRRAQFRLTLQQFLMVVPWTLFAALLLAATAAVVPKIWSLELDRGVWISAWLAGAAGLGLVAALVWTLLVRRGMLDAAIEVDRRFGLKERVSSAVALPASDRDTDVGRALVDDVTRRIESIEVREAFRVRLRWPAVLPLGTVLATLAVFFLVEDAQRDKATAASQRVAMREQIKRSAQELKKKLEERLKQQDDGELKDADQLFQQLRQGLDELTRADNVDRQKALVKMNDLAKELAKRRDALGEPDKAKQQLERLGNIERGPAEKLISALRAGDMGKATEEMKKLLEQLKNDNLTEEQRKQLAEQLTQAERKIRDAVEEHRQAMKELERQIQQKRTEGDMEAAGNLQRKLEQMQAQERQMQRLDQIANQLGRAQQAMKTGDMRSAASELDNLASELSELQAEMDQLETLDELMNEIADAKNAMSCKECGGFG
jgi:hypothetical protein